MQTRNVLKKYGPKLAAVGGSLVAVASQLAHATGESAAATAAAASVDTTKADMVLVAGGVLTLAIVLWGIYKLISMFGRK